MAKKAESIGAEKTNPATVRKMRSVDYVAQAQALDWSGLDTLWAQISARATPGWESGMAFEHLILRAFELSNAEVIWPYAVSLKGGGQAVEQIDGMIQVDHITCMIESKDKGVAINVEPLAKLRSQLMRRSAGVIGSVFSFSGFTEPARTLAQFMFPQAVLLWTGEEMTHI